MGSGRGVTAHAGPTHIHSILVRRPSSVGRLPVTELSWRDMHEEGRAKQVGVLSVCLPHLTLRLQAVVGNHTEIHKKMYKSVNTPLKLTSTNINK